jgi:hypothetical protein
MDNDHEANWIDGEAYRRTEYFWSLTSWRKGAENEGSAIVRLKREPPIGPWRQMVSGSLLVQDCSKPRFKTKLGAGFTMCRSAHIQHMIDDSDNKADEKKQKESKTEGRPETA